jgi:hypothetical protein
MGNPFTRRDSDRLLRVFEGDTSVAAVINVLEEFSGYDMPDGERLTVMKLINSYRRNYPDLSVKLQQSEINGLRLILEPNQEGGRNERLNRRLTRAEADAMHNLLRNDRSAAAAINVVQDLLRYDIPPSARANLPIIINTLRARHPDLSSPIGREQREILEEVIERVLFSFNRRGGFRRRSQTARFNRCVKTVKKSIVPRPDSNKESAAIAICTKTVLQTRGRTLKKYRKGHIRTQKLRQ